MAEKAPLDVREARHPSIGAEVESFVREVNALNTSLPHAMFAIAVEEERSDDRFVVYAEKFGTVEKVDDKRVRYTFKPPYEARAALLSSQAADAEIARELVPRTFVLALVSQFDAFLGRLLRSIFLLRPELFADSERPLTFAHLLKLGTVEAATDHLLEKEIESVLRKSHADQFSWMESRFGIKLRKDLPSWATFIETTERRNLFAHANGVVSDEYLSNCAAQGVKLPLDCVKGVTLPVSPEYFKSAAACILEIGVKLSQVLWRKLIPDQLDEADSSLIRVTFDLIVSGRYSLAIELLNFGCLVVKKHASELNHRMLTINRAQAYKWHGDAARSAEVLADTDWSACGLEFQLARAVLRDEFEEAAAVMRSIGADGRVEETDYQEWPLFREFRQSTPFQEAFEEIYGKQFVHIATAMEQEERQHLKRVAERLKSAVDGVFESEDGTPGPTEHGD